MDDDQLLRYSRHIFLNELGIEGQQRLLDGRVLIIGAGGLGSPAALYLGAAGVGHITLVDDDRVDLTNLQRQIAHTQASIGQPKVESARQAMAAINPFTVVTALCQRADSALLDVQVACHDVVLDCSDNFATRHAINQACVTHRKPLVTGAAIRFDGQVTVYDTRSALSPCYACVFPATTSFEEARCTELGVLSALVGMIGTVQAAETIKLLGGVGKSLAGRLLMLDALAMEWSEIRVQRDVSCSVCAARVA